MGDTDVRNHAIAEGLNQPETDVHIPEYGDDTESPLSDLYPDGWEDAEHDPAMSVDDWLDDSWRLSRNRRPIIRFFTVTNGALEYRLAERNRWAQARAVHVGKDITFREIEHHLLAQDLLHNQAPAISASDPRAAYRVAKRISGSSYRTKSRSELIECLWGSAPLQFLTKWPPEPAQHCEKLTIYDELFNLLFARFSYLITDGNNPLSRKRLLSLPQDIKIDKRTYVSYLSYLEDAHKYSNSSKCIPLGRGEGLFLVRMALRDDQIWNELDEEIDEEGDHKENAVKSTAKVTATINELVSTHRYCIEALRRSPHNWTDDTLKSFENLSHIVKGNRGMEVTRFAIAGWEPEHGNDWYIVREPK